MLAQSETDAALCDEIRGVYLFTALDDAQFELVVRNMRRIQLRAGQRLFNQGAPSKRFYYVQKGQIKLFRLSADGIEKVIHVVCAGETFAEAVMFMEGARGYPVNAEAIDPVDLIGFDSESFRHLLRNSIDTCFRVMTDLSLRLRRRVDEIERLTLQNATCRLVSYLLEEIPSAQHDSAAEVELSVPKHILASRLSVKPETFSRVLLRLTRKGLIEVHGHTITLPDVSRLRELVHSS